MEDRLKRIFDRTKFLRKYIKPNMTVLDIGCGTGVWVKRLSEQFGARAVGIDVVNYSNTRYPFCLFDGYHLPFRDNAMDVGILIHVLHHTKNVEELLSECRRVSKDKIIIFEDMAASTLQNGLTRVNDFWGNKVKKFCRALQHKHSFNSLFIPMTYNYLTYGLWFALFKNLNLKIVEMISIPYKTMEHGVFVLSK